MAKHRPTVVWGIRKLGQDGYVRTRDTKTIELCFPDGDGMVLCVPLSRADARLWARRITQCLEGTK